MRKSNPYDTRGITPKRLRNGGAHLCGLALAQYSSGEKPQRWQAVGDTVSNLAFPGNLFNLHRLPIFFPANLVSKVYQFVDFGSISFLRIVS